jgi:hypothetical protein
MCAKIDEKHAELETIHKIFKETVLDFFSTFWLISDPITHVESEAGGTELAFPYAEVGGDDFVFDDPKMESAEFYSQDSLVEVNFWL